MDDSSGTVSNVASSTKIFFDIGMIFLPSIVYIPQYLKIMGGNVESGFSTFVSLVLISSNTLRLYFWLGKQFSFVLLWQALLMICAQLALLELWSRKRRKLDSGYVSTSPLRNLVPFNVDYWLRNFWRWNEFSAFMIVFVLYNLFWIVLTIMFVWYSWYVEFIGVISLAIESQLALPQFLKNWKDKTTHGLSTILVLCWALGDAIKVVYFLGTAAPVQFTLAAVVSVCLDLMVLRQILVLPLPLIAPSLPTQADPEVV